MKRIFSRAVTVLMVLLAVSACRTTHNLGTDAKKNDKAELTQFAFPAGKNKGIGTTATAIVANGVHYITVPEGTGLRKLVPEITASEGATVFIDGAPYKAGAAYDFSGDVQRVKIVSEDGGKTGEYRICVKTGDSTIDQRVYQFMRDFSIPGVSLSIMKGTQVVYSSGYGFAVAETETRCTPDHLFRMASISKQFCTLCIMQLKEEGRLQLDQQVFGRNGILKGLYHNITPYHEGITVRHLLSHSSGICKGLDDPAFNNDFRFYSGTRNPVPTDTLIQRTLDARQQPYSDGTVTWSPGSAYNYSNVGYCVLHRIVEVVSGKDYERFLKEDVLSRMGITDTHIGGYKEERRPNECVFYSQGSANGYSNPLRELAGAAGIITSSNQLMKVLTYIDGDDTVPDIFSRETLQEMYTAYRFTAPGKYGEEYHTYGLGWRVNHARRFPGAHYHGGDIAGTATVWAGGTDSGMSGALICNSRSYIRNETGDIDDNTYSILDDAMKYFQ